MKHNSHSWIRFFLILFVFLIPVCFSDWIYLSKTATVEAGTKDSDMVTVTVHTRQQSNEETTTTDDQHAKATQVSDTHRTYTDRTTNPKSIGDIFTEKREISSTTTVSSDGTKKTVTKVYREEQVTNVTDISNRFVKKYSYDLYYFEWKVITTIFASSLCIFLLTLMMSYLIFSLPVNIDRKRPPRIKN